jgi:hypothetical protein
MSAVGSAAWYFPTLLGKWRSAAFVVHGVGGYFASL